MKKESPNNPEFLFLKIVFALLLFVPYIYCGENQKPQKESNKLIRPNYLNVYTKTKSTASVFEEPYFGSKIIDSIPKNTKILILDIKDEIYKISYGDDNKIGFVHFICIDNTEDVQLFKKFLLEKDEKQKTEELKIKEEKIKLAQEESERSKEKEKIKADSLKKEQEKQKHIKQELRKQRIIKTYGNNIANKILSNQIWIGMTKEMLFEVLGKPDDVNRTISAISTIEQFIYIGIPKNHYYYFENGILTSWQD